MRFWVTRDFYHKPRSQNKRQQPFIIQDPVSSIDADQPYLFGVNDGDWAATIEDMFSKKMDKLYVENNAYREYLSGEAANQLVKVSQQINLKNLIFLQNLPTADKKIWFKASLFKEIDLAGCGEVNDHIVKGIFVYLILNNILKTIQSLL